MTNASYLSSEVSVAASYYNLYSNSNNNNDTAAASSSPPQNTSNNNIVQDDTWTLSEKQQAESILLAARDKCLISSSTLSKEQAEHELWNRFYQSHQTNFFKDKHYLSIDFPEEFGETAAENKCCVEIGCGVGNAILSLLEQDDDTNPDDNKNGSIHSPRWTVHCLDFSAQAIDLLRQEPRFVKAAQQQRAYAHVCDITMSLPPVCKQVASVATLFFCLSAIAPSQHLAAARNSVQSLQPQGVLILRDYGRYDAAQLRLGQERNKLVNCEDAFYRKHDGTKCYYFTLEDLEHIFVHQLQMEVIELRYMCKVFENRATQTKRRRVWVSARFRKIQDL